MSTSPEDLYEGFGNGNRNDPTLKFQTANDAGRIILDLGDRAKTLLIDDQVTEIRLLNKLIDGGKLKNLEGDPVDLGFGIHVAAMADGLGRSNDRKIVLRDEAGDPSVEILSLVESALLGGAVGSEDDINLRIGSFDLNAETGPFLEVLVDGKWSTDVLRIEGDLAADLLTGFEEFGYSEPAVNVIDLHQNPSSDSDNPTVFSGTDGQVDVFVYDFAVGRQDFEYMQVNNFNSDEDYFVFTNFELDGDGAPTSFPPAPPGGESLQERFSDDGQVSLNAYNLFDGFEALFQNFTFNTGLGGATDVISVFFDDGVTPALGVLSDEVAEYATGPVTAQEDRALIFEGDFIL